MQQKKSVELYTLIFILIVILYFAMSTISCSSATTNIDTNVIKPVESILPTQTPVIEKPIKSITPIPTPTIIPEVIPTMSWEKDHPERKEWSKILFNEIKENFTSLEKAQDFSKYCPKYKTLEDDQKKMAWAEFWIALMYYESGWNPKSQSVDVGTKSDKNTWSVGLTQISQVDQKNHKLKMNYSYQDLLEVEPNLDLAFAIFSKQLEKQKLVSVNKSVYWAVISGKLFARYEKNDEIASKTRKYVKECI